VIESLEFEVCVGGTELWCKGIDVSILSVWDEWANGDFVW